jgi:hypothetical protein
MLSHFARSLSHFSSSRIDFGVFLKRNCCLLSHFAHSLSHFSSSRIDFGVFLKRNCCLLSHFARSLSHFSNSRNHHKYPYVAPAMPNMPIFAQVDRYRDFLT